MFQNYSQLLHVWIVLVCINNQVNQARCDVWLVFMMTELRYRFSVIRILIVCYVHLRTKLISTMSLVRYKHYGVLTAGITLVQWLSL